MMLVKTLRKHLNDYDPAGVKEIGGHYEVSDQDGTNLIADGMVEEVSASARPDDGATPSLPVRVRTRGQRA